ncbi:MAG TPA: hypothetical protein VFW87_23460 [Pirellulales bacterium]|nr:hypothetical protein [Pirellulales bacterium]
MPSFKTIALTTIALLTLAVTFALGCYTAAHKSRLDTVESGLSDLNDVEAAQNKRIDLIERTVERLQARLGRGPGASQ